MKKLSITCNEVAFLIQGLSQLKGMKDFKKAIALGDDIRKLRNAQKAIEEAVKLKKPEKYDALLKEFQELKQKKAKEFGDVEGEILSGEEIGAHVMLVWPKAKDWNAVNREYQEALTNIGNETIELELQTEKLVAADFEKKALDASMGEVLSYFQ